MVQEENIAKERVRDFQITKSNRAYLFEGIAYMPYDVFLRQDITM